MGLSLYLSSMSSKTDVIYSHKKFKKAALEACERKEAEDRSVIPPDRIFRNNRNLVEANYDKCSCNGSNSCSICIQAFRSKGEYLRHKVLLSKHIQSKDPPQNVEKAIVLLNRSVSVPATSDKKDLHVSKMVESESRPIYKPKFRAQYSVEDTSDASEEGSCSGYYSLVSRANTYHDSSVSYASSDHFDQISAEKSTDDAQKIKYGPSNKATSSHGLWKGIKAPSPELVGQHITNLIVQNKAIVETHSPFWPMKYKRHLSTGCMLDGESIGKAKLPADLRYRNISRSKSPHCPHYNTNTENRLSHQATISSTSPHPLTKIRRVKVDTKSHIRNFNEDFNPYCHSEMPRGQGLTNCHPDQSEDSVTSQQSISSDSFKIEECTQCGMRLDSRNMLHHLNMLCKKPIIFELSANEDEGHSHVANSLMKRNKDNQGHHENVSEMETVDETDHDYVKHNKIGSSSNHKLNAKGKNLEFTNILLSKVNVPNGKVFYQSDYNSRGMDELHKPKSNSHHIYGGEVKICDGNAFKTLKIDSVNSETPSLDVCLASRHLGAAEPLPSSHTPTSVIVKFAKCGLSSGGTMVQVDNKKYCNTNVARANIISSGYYPAPVQSNLNYRKDSMEHNPSTKVSSFSLTNSNCTRSSIAGSFYPESYKDNIATAYSTSSSDCSLLRVPLNTAHKELLLNQHPQPHLCEIKKDNYPAVLSIGTNNVPYVPGIPGPYSQPNGVTPLKGPVAMVPKISNSCKKSNIYEPITVTSAMTNVVPDDKVQSCFVSPSKYNVNKENLLKCDPEFLLSPDQSANESCFLVPRKRPSSLPIKLTSSNSKSSLIGSTLVSPDTPRPKKSCAQLLLNGAAYTYLNMKVSTKTFFCCIYRPQPMYVLQATNPKLSMYSNWQVRKTEDTLNLSPGQLMGLHVSGMYYDRAYTIAKPKNTQMIVTSSATGETNCKIVLLHQSTMDNSCENDSIKRKLEDEITEEGDGKRVRIFEGGFKTNEDYTYVRGRGRGRYVCETCGIRCKKPSMLKKHIRTHTDLRPFACVHCSFSFKTKGNLTKHLKSKAHYKRCTEMGIRPVPTVVDETHINKEALELQGKIDLTINNCQSADDEEDSDDEIDESEDEDLDEFDDDDRSCDNTLDLTKSSVPTKEDSYNQTEGPIDLSIKRSTEMYKSPYTLNLISGPSNGSNSSVESTNSLVVSSRKTPIKEKADEILSPVTESSHLLKSIYDTTLKVSKVAVPVKESEGGGSMLQKYLREMAVLDTARKRKYIRVTESRESLQKRNRIISSDDTTENPTTFVVSSNCETKSSCAINIAAAIATSCIKLNEDNETVIAKTSLSSLSEVVVPAKKREFSPCHTTVSGIHTMPSVPANMVVINTSGSDSKTAFMSPSGVIPTMLNRPGCDEKSKCSICEKVFTKQSQLSLHMNVHYIERPHRCESCSISFRTSGHLQKHMRSVSHYNKLNMNMTFGTPSSENPRPFKCHDCKSAFRIHGHLAKHLRSKLHIMRLECLSKLPFGTYAEIERSGVSLNDIDTSDCENSLDSLQYMASKLQLKDSNKVTGWNEPLKSARVRTVSNSSNNSDDYSLEDEPDQKHTQDDLGSGLEDETSDINVECDTNDEEDIESEGLVVTSGEIP